jgi:hypothetical protein
MVRRDDGKGSPHSMGLAWRDTWACPDEDEWNAFAFRMLGLDRRAELADHASSCPSCRTLLAELLVDETVASGESSRGGQPIDLPRGTQIDRYVVDRVLGAGGMGLGLVPRGMQFAEARTYLAITLARLGDRAGAEAARVAAIAELDRMDGTGTRPDLRAELAKLGPDRR